MNTFKTTLLAAALSLSSAAFADGFPVDIHGSFTTNTRTGDVKANANGQNAKADINVAGVQGSGLVDYSATVNAGNIATSATGTNTRSLANVGGVQGFKQ